MPAFAHDDHPIADAPAGNPRPQVLLVFGAVDVGRVEGVTAQFEHDIENGEAFLVQP